MADLDVDVAGADRARAVTDVLGACVADDDDTPWPARAVAEWTLAERLQALLAVRIATISTHTMVSVICPMCDTGMELEIDLSAFLTSTPPPLATVRTSDGREVVVRLPRGVDQARWIDGAVDHPADIAASLVTGIDGVSPSPDFRVPTHWIDDIDDALRERDPLTALAASASCPECGTMTAHDIDLEALLLSELAAEQRRHLDDVYRLASAFHWTERDILALPSWRRRRYLAQLDADEFP